MKTWTVDLVMAEEPCKKYTRGRVEEIFGDKKTLTTLEILKVDNIPAEDRVWIALRTEDLPDSILEKFAAQTADRAVREHALHCGIRKVENWAQKWLSGEDRSEQSATDTVEAIYIASAAAWAAKAARMAAKAATGAAKAAAQAAWAAWAWEATWEAWAAAKEAEAKEWVTQVQDLIALIEGKKNVSH